MCARFQDVCVSVAVWGALTGSAAAGVILDGVSDSLYLDLADDPAYDAVGSVRWTEGSSSYIGSGAYLGDGWVLTAAHVADGDDFAGGGQSNWRFTVDGSTYYADDFYVHPDWTASGGDLGDGVDIALVRLSTESVRVDPALLYQGDDELGEIATMVGYGNTGEGSDGYASSSSGQKRAGQNVIDADGGDSRVRGYDNAILFTDFDSPAGSDSIWGDSDPLALEYMTAPGDSGGGLFIEEDGVSYLAGVTSFGLAFDGDVDSDYGDAGGYTRVSQHLDWIDEITGLLSAQELPVLQGDFNGDGVVDAADYTLWRDTLGDAVSAGSGADANGDGLVDQADYDIWFANYGTTPSGGASALVPEPSTAMLIFGLSASLCRFGKPNRDEAEAVTRPAQDC